MEPRRDVTRLMPAPRAAVWDVVRHAQRPLTVADIAERVGQHRNTARGYLDDLIAAGLVQAEPAPPSGRGRPVLLYSSREADVPAGGAYGPPLSLVLAEQLAAARPEPGVAEAVGTVWADRMISQAAEQGAPAPDPVAVLDELGFEPEAGEDGRSVVLRRCPFGPQGSSGPQSAVCPVHEAMLLELLRRSGEDVSRARLERATPDNPCTLHFGA